MGRLGSFKLECPSQPRGACINRNSHRKSRSEHIAQAKTAIVDVLNSLLDLRCFKTPCACMSPLPLQLRGNESSCWGTPTASKRHSICSPDQLLGEASMEVGSAAACSRPRVMWLTNCCLFVKRSSIVSWAVVMDRRNTCSDACHCQRRPRET